MEYMKIILFIIISCLFLLPIVYSPLIDGENETSINNETVTTIEPQIIVKNPNQTSTYEQRQQQQPNNNLIVWIKQNMTIIYIIIAIMSVVSLFVVIHFLRKTPQQMPQQEQYRLSYDQEIIDETKKK
jgi:amino acid transporter